MTVSALGFPKDWSFLWNRIFRGLDLFTDQFWPHRFYNYQLNEQVENVFHALSIDDERRTFHPRVWKEKDCQRPQNIEQVWFAGAHSNVGGGYERPGLADVALHWMMVKAEGCGLEFENGVLNKVEHAAKAQQLEFKDGSLDTIKQDANVHDKLYDSRDGLAIYYRYAPRDLEKLCLDRVEEGSIKIHQTVFDRMRRGTAGYFCGHLWLLSGKAYPPMRRYCRTSGQICHRIVG